MQSGCGDEEYLRLLHSNLQVGGAAGRLGGEKAGSLSTLSSQAALGEFEADLIIYNAGTDVLEGDALGRMRVSPLWLPLQGGGGLRGRVVGVDTGREVGARGGRFGESSQVALCTSLHRLGEENR